MRRYEEGDIVRIICPKEEYQKKFMKKKGQLTKPVADQGLWEVEFEDGEIETFSEDEFEFITKGR
jgi:hypothetical protein